MKQGLVGFVISVLVVATIVIGCGDSNNFVSVGQDNANTGSIQVEFNRSNVLAQSTVSAFAGASHYAVDVVNTGTRTFIRPTTFVASATGDRQVIVMTGIPVGDYDIVVTAFLNGLQTGQLFIGNVGTSVGGTSIIGQGTSFALEPVTGAPFIPNFPPGQGPVTTGTGGYGTGGYGTGGYGTGGYGN